MVEIYPNLFIGSQVDYERDVRFKQGWAVVHACKDPYHRNLLGYRTQGAPKNHPEYLIARRGDMLFLNLVDADDPSYIPKEIIDAALVFIQDALDRKLKVLVHCNLGESRAPGIGLLYLASYTDTISKDSVSEAESGFRLKYPPYMPKSGIAKYIQTNWSTYKRPSQ